MDFNLILWFQLHSMPEITSYLCLLEFTDLLIKICSSASLFLDLSFHYYSGECFSFPPLGTVWDIVSLWFISAVWNWRSTEKNWWIKCLISWTRWSGFWWFCGGCSNCCITDPGLPSHKSQRSIYVTCILSFSVIALYRKIRISIIRLSWI